MAKNNKQAASQDGNSTKKTTRKKKKVKVSHIVKPENMTLEEWQIKLRKQVTDIEHFDISCVGEALCPGDMTLEFCILQILIDTKIKLVGQEQIIYFILELEQVGKRQGFAYQCDIHIGKRLVGSFDPRAKKYCLTDMREMGEYREHFLPVSLFYAIFFHLSISKRFISRLPNKRDKQEQENLNFRSLDGIHLLAELYEYREIIMDNLIQYHIEFLFIITMGSKITG